MGLLLFGMGLMGPAQVSADVVCDGSPITNETCLIAAILDANEIGGPAVATTNGTDSTDSSTIVLADGATIYLTGAYEYSDELSNGGYNGLPPIGSYLTITVDGADINTSARATIVRESEGALRLFEILPYGYLDLNNVTLGGGLAQWGGGIYNAGDLYLNNVIMEDHCGYRGKTAATRLQRAGGGGGGAGIGGALFNAAGGNAVVYTSTFRDNSSVGGNGASWLGYVGGEDASGGNGGGPDGGAGSFGSAPAADGGFGSGGGGGGATWSAGGPAGDGGYGGGGGGGGGTTGGCGDSGFPPCSGIGGAGGFAGGNGQQGFHSGAGGAGGGAGLGGAIANFGHIELLDSTLVSNTASGGSGGSDIDGSGEPGQGLGGAIFTDGQFNIPESLYLTNVTIASNSASDDGGGIYVRNDTFDAQFLTLATNTAGGNGGGLALAGTIDFNVTNSIIAGNTDISAPTYHPDCSDSSDDLYGAGYYSLVGLGTGCNDLFDEVYDGNIVGDGISGMPAILVALADNGGPTLHHCLGHRKSGHRCWRPVL